MSTQSETVDPVEVRTPPVRAIFASHLPRAPGKCDWCGLPCEDRTPARKQLRLRHYACDAELDVIQRPAQARWYVEKRDHGICVDCGEDWSDRYRFAKGTGVIICGPWECPDPAQYRSERAAGFWGYTEVIWVSLWHVDHRVPLWKVRDMPPLQRIEYFKLANLVTRCEPCHKVKTRREAAERSKFNDMATDAPAADDKPKRRWGSRPMGPSRGFPPKGSRPMRRKP